MSAAPKVSEKAKLLRSTLRPACRPRLSAALLLAVLLLAASFAGAQAHAIVVRSDPPDGAVVGEAPHEIRLWFSEPVAPELTQVQVLDGRGQVVPGTTFRVDAVDGTLLIVTAPELPDDIYNVAYATTSAADGHPTQGHLVFSVGAGAPTPSPSATPAQPPVPWLEVTLRWLAFIALAGLAGSVAVAFILLGPAARQNQHTPALSVTLWQARRRVLGWGAAWALLGFAVGVALLVEQALALAGPAGAGAGAVALSAGRVLTATRTGAFWLYQQTLLVTLAVLLFILWRGSGQTAAGRMPRGAGLILALFCVTVLVLQSLSGHAVTLTPNTALAVVADALHLVSAGLWVGGLFALGVGLLPLALRRRNTPGFAALARAGWRPFGALAAVAVGLLIATGLYSTGRQVASLAALVSTLYGRTLLIKIGLVLAMGLFGLLNSSLLHPTLVAPFARLLRRPPGWTPLSIKRLPWLVIVETGLGLLVLLATGALLTMPPAHGAALAQAGLPAQSTAPAQASALAQASGQQSAPAAAKLTQRVDDLLISLQARPNQPGPNTIQVEVSERRQPPSEVLRVILRFTYLGQDVGVISADAESVFQGTAQDSSDQVWQLRGDELSIAGPWQVDVVVRRKGLEDSTAKFDWTVASVGEEAALPGAATSAQTPRPAASALDRPLEPILTVAAATVLAGLIIVIAATLWLRRSGRHASAGTEGQVHG